MKRWRTSGLVSQEGIMFLEGIRVLELTIGWAGPFAGAYLGDLGAEVVHIEGPTSRGPARTGADRSQVAAELAAWSWGQLPGPTLRAGTFPDADPGDRPWNRSGHNNLYNRNKLSLCMDMKHSGAREVFLDLVRVSDVLISNFSPEGQSHLGIEHDELAKHNPMIVTVQLTGYGLTGPAAPRRSWGPILEGHSGLAAATGYEGGGPMKMGVALPDAIGGLHGVVATLGALRLRQQLGHGMAVDVSQLETYSSYGGEHYLSASLTGEEPPRRGNRSASAAPQGVYRCTGTDEWVAISVESDTEWRALCEVIGGECGTAADASREQRIQIDAEIHGWIEEWTAVRTKHEAMHVLQARGVRAAAVMTNKEVVHDPHIAARGFMVEWDQVDVGWRQFPGFPIRVHEGDTIPLRGTAALGADNAYVLTKVLGYPEKRVDDLTSQGVLFNGPPMPEDTR
jgi:crotonobetainyl-CoA:carnitine CoA-transferase CaiB-like acyl-CoA transferase